MRMILLYLATALFSIIFPVLANVTFANGGEVRESKSKDGSEILSVANGNVWRDITNENDILYLSDEIKKQLDDKVGFFRRKEKRAVELHRYLFTDHGLNIQYSSDTTKTAVETFEAGYGNCVSLANLYVASARYLGLNAKYQKVKVPRDWEVADDFYIIPGHMNVRVKLNSKSDAVVELVSTYLSMKLDDELIKDQQAFAEYYSNVGVESLTEKKFTKAIAYLEKSTQVYPKLAFAWSNLGVAYKLVGEYDKAEQAYLKAIELDKRDLSAIKNLYGLYSTLNQTEKLEKLAERVEKYRSKNPYVIAQNADLLFHKGYYKRAISLYKKAIKKKNNESKFYRSLARAYFKLGRYDKAEKAQLLAVEHAANLDDERAYKRKLELIKKKVS